MGVTGNRHVRVGAAVLAASLLLMPTTRAAEPAAGPAEEALLRELGAERVARHPATGKVSFVGASRGRAMPRPAGVTRATKPDAAAIAFLGRYGRLFGVEDPDAELHATRQRLHQDGRATVRFEQHYRGVPVIAGALVVNLDERRDILSVNGEVLPIRDLETVPTVSAARAQGAARDLVIHERGVPADAINTERPVLSIYDPALLGAPGFRGPRLVWRVRVMGTAAPAEIDELVLVDARSGSVALHFDQIMHAKTRLVCDKANDPAAGRRCEPPYTRQEGDPPTGVTEVDRAYRYSGQWYDFFKATFDRDSFDGAGAPIVASVRYCSPAPGGGCMPGSSWSGQLVFSDGEAVDDIVGHELTHGFITSEANLFYFGQSGAINESLADIYGEFIDQLNTGTADAGNDSASAKWKLFEDAPYPRFLRDMKDPMNIEVWGAPQPDRMTSEQFYSEPADRYGVHWNSGVGNKAAYLLTDGDTFNGWTVRGLGIEKAARVYYEAVVSLLTTASDYRDLYDALPQACKNLVGTAGITSADCIEVVKAVTATEMHLDPVNPAWNGRGEAARCAAGEAPSGLYSASFESATPGWSSTGLPSSAWTTVAYYATSGTQSWFGSTRPQVATDSALAMTSDVTLPAAAYLHFRHAHAFMSGAASGSDDGGVVEYSADGGATWSDVGDRFDDNGYTGTLRSDTGNPLGGRGAFTGESVGYYSSRADLSSLAGQSVRFRFRVGTDTTFGGTGWYVDDVSVYTCVQGETDRPVASLRIASTAPAGSTIDGVSSRTVDLHIAATDGPNGSGVTSMRLRDAGRTWSSWEPYGGTRSWTVPTGDGLKVVETQVRDAVGNMSTVARDTVLLDTTFPTIGSPVESFRRGDRIGSSGVPVRLGFSASDTGAGVDYIFLLERTDGDGGPEISVGAVDGAAGSLMIARRPSATIFRDYYAVAVDGVGNGIGSPFGPAFRVRLLQEGSTMLRYSAGWTAVSVADASGGSVKRTATVGAAVSFTVTARDFAIVATKGSARGRFDVYIDGTKVTTTPVDLYRTSPLTRSVVFARSFPGPLTTHTVRLVVRAKAAASTGNTVDLDAVPFLQ